jgi:hypothetical protein
VTNFFSVSAKTVFHIGYGNNPVSYSVGNSGGEQWSGGEVDLHLVTVLQISGAINLPPPP